MGGTGSGTEEKSSTPSQTKSGKEKAIWSLISHNLGAADLHMKELNYVCIYLNCAD